MQRLLVGALASDIVAEEKVILWLRYNRRSAIFGVCTPSTSEQYEAWEYGKVKNNVSLETSAR
jgi:hypothetical protein